ncbi:MAG: DUF5668 domain-containing protein [Caldisericia bacterium]
MNKNRGYLFGIVLIAVGALLLVFKFANFSFDWNVIWPLIMIGVGLMLFASAGKDKGVVFPATIVAGIGALFLLQNMGFLGPYNMGDLWPFFPIIVGIGFVVLYFADKKDSGVLIPASILLIVGAVFLSINISGMIVYIAPSVIILIGAVIIFNSFRTGKTDDFTNTAPRFDFGEKKDSDGRVSEEKSEEIPVTYINEDEEIKDE